DGARDDLPLNAERPFLEVVRTEMWTYVSLVKRPRVADAQDQERRQLLAGRHANWLREQRNPCCRGSSQCLEQHLRSSRGDVQVDVIERRVVGESVASAQGCPSRAPAPVRVVSKTDAGPQVGLDRWNLREGSDCERQR